MSNLDEEMKANALEAMKLTRKHFVVELDFSPASIGQLEGLVDDVDFSLKGGRSDENIALLVRTWGSYLGEVIRRNVGGEWNESTDQELGVRLVVGAKKLDPHDAVRKRLTEASKPSVEQFYSDVAH